MTGSEVLYTKDAHIATLRLNAPDRSNSLSDGMIEDLFDAAAKALHDEDVRVIVLTGSGSAFCDDDPRPAASPGPGDGEVARQQLRELFTAFEREPADALLRLDKPTIASINGNATGNGFELALSCDMRIAAHDALLATMHLRRGLVPGVSTYLLPRVVGLGKACELLFTADPIDGREAERIGLADQAVPADELEQATYALAARIAKGPPVAMRFTKRALFRGLGSTMDAAKEYTTMARTLGMRITEETREGFQSFVDKREPHF
jgi:2-(1,2-epoxy-1,2-dihydrophenyl)acetyl-CoA isomerase